MCLENLEEILQKKMYDENCKCLLPAICPFRNVFQVCERKPSKTVYSNIFSKQNETSFVFKINIKLQQVMFPISPIFVTLEKSLST